VASTSAPPTSQGVCSATLWHLKPGRKPRATSREKRGSIQSRQARWKRPQYRLWFDDSLPPPRRVRYVDGRADQLSVRLADCFTGNNQFEPARGFPKPKRVELLDRLTDLVCLPAYSKALSHRWMKAEYALEYTKQTGCPCTLLDRYK
jgi:hypothetical protein